LVRGANHDDPAKHPLFRRLTKHEAKKTGDRSQSRRPIIK
jgi:hypothetical protein